MKTLTIWFRFEICGLQIQNKCEKLHNCRQRVGKQRGRLCAAHSAVKTLISQRNRALLSIWNVPSTMLQRNNKKAQQSKSVALVITNAHKTATIFSDYVHVHNRIRAFPPNIFPETYFSGQFLWTISLLFLSHTDARYWYSNSTVRLSVCQWRPGIRWKRLNILSQFFHRTVAQSF